MSSDTATALSRRHRPYVTWRSRATARTSRTSPDSPARGPGSSSRSAAAELVLHFLASAKPKAAPCLRYGSARSEARNSNPLKATPAAVPAGRAVPLWPPPRAALSMNPRRTVPGCRTLRAAPRCPSCSRQTRTRPLRRLSSPPPADRRTPTGASPKVKQSPVKALCRHPPRHDLRRLRCWGHGGPQTWTHLTRREASDAR